MNSSHFLPKTKQVNQLRGLVMAWILISLSQIKGDYNFSSYYCGLPAISSTIVLTLTSVYFPLFSLTMIRQASLIVAVSGGKISSLLVVTSGNSSEHMTHKIAWIGFILTVRTIIFQFASLGWVNSTRPSTGKRVSSWFHPRTSRAIYSEWRRERILVEVLECIFG